MVKKTIKEIKQAFEKEGYILLEEEYINCKHKMKYICPNGHKHEIAFDKFLQGQRCPECSQIVKANKRKLNYIDIKQAFEEEGYELLEEEYISAKTLMEYKCTEGHIHKITWSNFKKGRRCPECYGKNIKLSYDFIKNTFEKEGYELLSEEYINNNQKLKYRCPNGHIHEMSFSKFKNGRRCPECYIFKGENRIKQYLENNNIPYIIQKTFDDCKDKELLRFDFYLLKYNICIEYDGIQHFEPTDFAGYGQEYAKKRLKESQKRDKIKDEYCKNNNIRLIRIPYWDLDNIENILKQELNLG